MIKSVLISKVLRFFSVINTVYLLGIIDFIFIFIGKHKTKTIWTLPNMHQITFILAS